MPFKTCNDIYCEVQIQSTYAKYKNTLVQADYNAH